MSTIDSILNPKSIAVIGASTEPNKRGYMAIAGLQNEGYLGKIFPINPKATEILGLACYKSIAEVPDPVDLAIVCTPARLAPEMIRQCGEKSVRGALLLAGGFSESGEEGRVLEENTIAVARKYGVRVIGPNTNGIYSSRMNCHAVPWPKVLRGSLAVLANSANVVLSLVTEAEIHGYMGISTMLSVGNQADIYFHEYLDAMAGDEGTHSIAMYVEGFRDGPAFLRSARLATDAKPIVMFLSGRTEEGKRAAKSHSASLAGDYAVGAGVLRQAGVVLVTQAEHLYPVAETLALVPEMRGRRVAVISEGGGVITVASEALAERGLELAQLSETTQAKIHAIVPGASLISNPVDHGGGTDPLPDYYGSIGQAVLEDDNIDALLLVGFFGGYGVRYGAAAAAAENAVSRKLGDLMRKHGKPVVVQSHYAHYRTEGLDVLRKGGVPFCRHIEVAAQCLAAAAEHHAARRRKARAAPEPLSADKVRELLDEVRSRGDAVVLEPPAREVLRLAGIAVAPEVVISKADQAVAAIAKFGDAPLAMKIVSVDVLHKSDVGGVRLNVRGEADVRAQVGAITESVLRHRPGARIAGVLATPMAGKGVELIVGLVRDPQYGPVVMFGLGGIFVEALRDVSFRAVPLSRADADEMIGEIKAKAMLDGLRGLPRVDRAAIADLLVKISQLAAACPEIQEIDLNPVIATEGGYAIADARMILGAPS